MADEEKIETEIGRIDVEEPKVEESDAVDIHGDEDEGEWVAEVVEHAGVKPTKEKKEKKVKKGKKKKEEAAAVVEVPVLKKKVRDPEPTIVLDGLKTIKIRTLSQRIMGCVVGEHVTTETPWTTISKEKVDENLDLHEESSDFLPIRSDLKNYTNPKILVGYDPEYEPDEDEDHFRFYVAVTDEARETIMERLREERREQEEKLKNSINKTVLPWKSLGSEKEVDESISFNSRPLIELELEAEIDELLKPIHLKDRNVEDSKDGYVKIGPGRIEFKGIRRRRVDTATQAIPPVTSGSAQTDPGLPMNVWTQYVYDMDTIKEEAEQEKKKRPRDYKEPDFVIKELDYLDSALEYNETFDLYMNDYPLLVLKDEDSKIPKEKVFEEYQAYTDVGNCKGKYISCIAWHPMWSGVVALSYVSAVRAIPAPEAKENIDEATRDIFARNPVLVWSFKDSLQPLLILECPREIQTLAWCPTDANVLVGGSVSGQVVVWDLNGKLSAVEGREYLTPDQQKYRLVMHSLLDWMRSQPPAKFVRPAALSNLAFSHKGRVTELQWMSPYYMLTDTGHFRKVREGTAMQFMTCSEDGTSMVWDLSRDSGESSAKSKKKKARKRPSALTADVSKYKSYDRLMRPIYHFSPVFVQERAVLMLTGLALEIHKLSYEVDFVCESYTETSEKTKSTPSIKSAQETEVVVETQAPVESTDATEAAPVEPNVEVDESANQEDQEEEQEKLAGEGVVQEVQEEKLLIVVEPPKHIEQKISEEIIRRDSITYREIFKPVLQPSAVEPLKYFHVATEEGELISLKWEGYEFNRGEKITTEGATVLNCGHSVHDGPIIKCARSPFISDLILTVGGKVLALWKDSLKDRPVIWKASTVRLTTCCWSPYRPTMILVGREDGSLEVWDFIVRSEVPVLVQSVSGKPLTYLAHHTLDLYGGQNILGVADYNNSFRMLFFPNEYQQCNPDDLKWMKSLVEKEAMIRENYMIWADAFIKRNMEELQRQREEYEEAERKKIEEEKAAEAELLARAKLEEDEAKRLRSKGAHLDSFNEKIIEELKREQEKQMQRVLLEKKSLNRTELLAKQQPVVALKQMEEEKRKKQKQKIQQQQKIFDKTVTMLFPDIVEKPPEGPTKTEELETELMALQPVFMEEYVEMEPKLLEYMKANPFIKRFKWEKVFEEGKQHRNVLDFSLYLRHKRHIRYEQRKKQRLQSAPPSTPKQVPEPKRLPKKASRSVVFRDEISEDEGSLEGRELSKQSSVSEGTRISLSEPRIKKSTSSISKLRRSFETMKEKSDHRVTVSEPGEQFQSAEELS